MNKAFLPFICLSFALGAAAAVPAPVKDVNGVVDNTPDSIAKALTARPAPGSTRAGGNPVLFLVGNSTMRTGTLGNGNSGQWGWGYFMHEYFDPSRISVENQALGGMSTRTFYNRLWPDILAAVRPGDYVIIELGHNDNGPFDSGRARATIPGISRDSINVVIKETGQPETVYSYGEYLRRYVDQVKRAGGTPILMSLTPRLAYDDKDSTKVTRTDSTFGLWASQIAREKGVPYIDLNRISADKFERFGKEKVKTMFYLDRIHTSALGARLNAESAAEGIRAASDLNLKDYLLPVPKDEVTGSSRVGERPVVFIAGDDDVAASTGGWGDLLSEYVDPKLVSVENYSAPGSSARSFMESGRWDKIYNALQPGDFVLLSFGHNDNSSPASGLAVGALPGAGGESRVMKMKKSGDYKVVYTYGWYLRKFIMDAREKGAVPVIVVPMETAPAKWAREVAAKSKVELVDINQRTAEFWKEPFDSTRLVRAEAVAVADGLRAGNSGLENRLKPLLMDFDMNKVGAYDPIAGYGFDFDTRRDVKKAEPFIFSAKVPRDGNYRVTVTLGNRRRAASTTVRAESRRLMLENVETKKGQTVDRSFIVHKRTPVIPSGGRVKINPREKGTMTWDDKITLEFTGDAPAVERVRIEPVAPEDSVTTVFLCGNSTVVDQTYEPWASWGQIVPRYFDSSVAIANHAESGESASSFLAKNRLDKVLSMARPGDYMFIEFGHNDQKERRPGSGAWYNFSANLKIFIDRARKKGINLVLVTPACRRSFDAEGHVRDTHLDYPDAIRAIGERENIPVIDLNAMTKQLYEALGEERSKKAFVHYPAGTFAGQKTDLEDNTHFNPFGATEIAKCILEGIKEKVPGLAPHIVDSPRFDPAQPDDPDKFVWPVAIFVKLDRPYGS